MKDHATPSYRLDPLKPKSRWAKLVEALRPNRRLMPLGKPRLVRERDDLIYIRHRGFH